MAHTIVNIPDNTVPVVFATDTAYVPYAGVALESLIRHANPKRRYAVFILHTDLSRRSQERLEALSAPHVSVKCLNIQTYLPKHRHLYNQNHYSSVMFYRFWIPRIFLSCQRVIYLDTDILIRHDIGDLYDVPLGDFVIGGCVKLLRQSFRAYCTKTLKLNPDTYVNSGVLVFHVPMWNRYHLTNRAVRLIGTKHTWIAPDQDILNKLCQSRILPLDPRWNQMATVLPQHRDRFALGACEAEIALAPRAYIYHYVSARKPWLSVRTAADEAWHQAAQHSRFATDIQRARDKRQDKLYHDIIAYLQAGLRLCWTWGTARRSLKAKISRLGADIQARRFLSDI